MKTKEEIEERIGVLEAQLIKTWGRVDALVKTPILTRVEVEQKEAFELECHRLRIKIYELLWVLEK